MNQRQRNLTPGWRPSQLHLAMDQGMTCILSNMNYALEDSDDVEKRFCKQESETFRCWDEHLQDGLPYVIKKGNAGWCVLCDQERECRMVCPMWSRKGMPDGLSYVIKKGNAGWSVLCDQERECRMVCPMWSRKGMPDGLSYVIKKGNAGWSVLCDQERECRMVCPMWSRKGMPDGLSYVIKEGNAGWCVLCNQERECRMVCPMWSRKGKIPIMTIFIANYILYPFWLVPFPILC